MKNEISLIDLLCFICACLSMVTFTYLFCDISRARLRVCTKVLVLVTFLLLFVSLGYAFYDLFKGGVKIVY